MDRADLTGPLVDRLLADPAVDRVLLWDNGSTDLRTIAWQGRASADLRVSLRNRPKVGAWLPSGERWSLHASWNGTWAAAALAAQGGPCNVVLLNNDLTVPEGFVGHLVTSLRSAPEDVWAVYPDVTAKMRRTVDGRRLGLTRTRGLAPSGGLTGWAFALKGELWPDRMPLIDERFTLYCGDTDLVWQMQMRGGCAARVDGLPMAHRLGATRRAIDWKAMTDADRRLRLWKYPHGAGTRLDQVRHGRHLTTT